MSNRLTTTLLFAGALSVAACGGDSGTQPVDDSMKPDTTIAPASGPAELPRAFINSSAPAAPAAGGVVISVSAGGNLQAALNAAQPGDVIELASGATFTGNFTLPNKNSTSANWIVIRPANFVSLPAEGRRMTPTLAAQLSLPKLLSPNSNSAIATAAGAHHYRVIGLEVSSVATQTLTYAAISLGDGNAQQSTLAQVPHDLVLDRLYIHGFSTLTLRRCVALNSASTAIIDSWLSECHEKGADSQAIAGWNGPGPFKIVNNYLEGAGENLMFGGSDPSVPNLTPSDIEIRRNHFFKPVAWKGGVWTVKNLLEIKHAQRVLIEGNILENSWTDGQNGIAVALKSVNQNGTCSWCVTQDVTVRRNLIRNMGAGFNIAGSPDNAFPTIPARRIVVTDNVLSNINTGQFDGDGRGFATYGSASNVIITHNTMMSPTNSAFVFGPAGTQQLQFTARDNLVGGGLYGMLGDNVGGAAAFARYAPGGVFLGNVMIVASGGSAFPPGNSYPTTTTAVGLANIAAEDYRLLPTSPFKGKATDGRDPGADIDAVAAATVGVRIP